LAAYAFLLPWFVGLLPVGPAAMVALSVPFAPRPALPTTTVLCAALGSEHYLLLFQERGIAEELLARDVRRTLLTEGGWTRAWAVVGPTSCTPAAIRAIGSTRRHPWERRRSASRRSGATARRAAPPEPVTCDSDMCAVSPRWLEGRARLMSIVVRAFGND
jgi:hypothetical protein